MSIYPVVILYLCRKTPIMKAIEFKTKIGKQFIHIPKRFHAEIKNADEKDVRVIIFLDDPDSPDDQTFKHITKE